MAGLTTSKKYGWSNFLLSNAAKYMVASGAILKSFYPKLFHVTRVAHLLYNCVIKVKPHFEDVHQIVEKVKSTTVKNKPNSPLLVVRLSLL